MYPVQVQLIPRELGYRLKGEEVDKTRMAVPVMDALSSSQCRLLRWTVHTIIDFVEASVRSDERSIANMDCLHILELGEYRRLETLACSPLVACFIQVCIPFVPVVGEACIMSSEHTIQRRRIGLLKVFGGLIVGSFLDEIVLPFVQIVHMLYLP
jgi:hypothetical protein